MTPARGRPGPGLPIATIQAASRHAKDGASPMTHPPGPLVAARSTMAASGPSHRLGRRTGGTRSRTGKGAADPRTGPIGVLAGNPVLVHITSF